MRELARVLMAVGGILAFPTFMALMLMNAAILWVMVGCGMGLLVSGMTLDDWYAKKS